MPIIHRCLFAAALFGSISWSAPVAAEIIDFGSSFQPLPYVEDGLTFANLGTSPAIVASGGGDAYLTAGTNTDPIRVRATAAAPFDLVSFDINSIFQTWRVETSLGAVLNVTGPATVDFTSQSGFQGITYFEIIHDPAEANGTISVDNVVINYVPEPDSWWLVLIGGTWLVGWRLQRRHSEPRQNIAAQL